MYEKVSDEKGLFIALMDFYDRRGSEFSKLLRDMERVDSATWELSEVVIDGDRAYGTQITTVANREVTRRIEFQN